MEYRLFYSYQSDAPKKINEQFIEKAINAVIKKIKEPKVKLIKGFKGTSGQKPLADTMFDQSEISDIFIGDVTLTAEFNSHTYKNHRFFKSYRKIEKKGKEKKYPNGNVSLETGFSWAKKGYDRTILVMNESYGIPTELPVDMTHVRWPITYHLAEAHSEEEYTKTFNKLVEELKGAIKAALKTTRQYHRERFKPFKQHDVWKSSDFEKKLIVTDELKDVINQLRNGLLDSGTPQRLIGPKGSGKTRIARELFRKIDVTLKRDEESLEKVLYHDLRTSDYGHIQIKLQDIRDLNQDYIVIIDNCSIEMHKKICDELHGTNAKILTIATSDIDLNDSATIRLSDTYASDIIKKGLEERFQNPEMVSTLIQESGTNIEEAIAYISSEINDQDTIPDEYENKWKQLLGVELFNLRALDILEELSLFTHVGLNNHFEAHSHFIVSNLPKDITLEKYRGIILTLANKGIIKIVGDFVVLESFVEELTFQRIGKFDGKQFSEYILKVSEYKLSKQFGERLIKLSKDPQSNLVEYLVSEEGLFNDYDFINSDQGSLLIYKLSEIFPMEIGSLLFNRLDEKSTDELKEFKQGRRNIVWCLERLVLIEETAQQATRILYKLALSENESIANNATNAFIKIFQMYLSGTILSLRDRIQILKELIDTDGVSSIIVSALNIGLQTSNFYSPIRSWGANKKELKSYDQKNKITPEAEEDYYVSIIELLDSFLEELNFSSAVREIFVKRFPEQYKSGASEKIMVIIEKIIDNEKGLSSDLRHILEKMVLLQFGLEEEKLARIQKLLDQNQPIDDLDKLKVLVIDASHKHIREDYGWRDIAKEEAVQLAQEWVDENNTSWIDNLDLLLQGNQNQTFAFGEKLGQIYLEDKNLIEKWGHSLGKISFESQNIAFIVGFVVGKKDDIFTRTLIDSFLSNNVLKLHTVRLIHFLGSLTVDDVKKLMPVLITNPTFVRHLQYLKLGHLSDEEVVEVVNMVSDIPDFGKEFALELLWEVYRKDKDRWDGLKGEIKPRLLVDGILRYKCLLGNGFPVEDFIKKVISDEITHAEVQFFINEILNDYSELNVRNETLLNILTLHFLNEKFDIVWPLIGAKLLDESYLMDYNLKDILRFFNFDTDKLVNWCNDNLPLGAAKMIEIIPVEVRNEAGELKWTEQAKILIENYGDNENFLSALSSRLGNYTVNGSAVPLFEARKKLMEQLLLSEKVKVRDFAKEQIERIKIYIAREQNFDNNYKLGEI